jgi:ferric-dicitrate binding protein FerR (iron transport regulator)
VTDEPTPQLAHLLDRLSAESARPEFSERLKRQFVQGAFGSVATPEPTPPHESLRRPSWGPIAAAMLTAAAAIVLIWMQLGADAIGFEVLDAAAGAEIRIDGNTYSLGDGVRVSRALRGSREIRTLDQALLVRVADLMTLELGPESHVEILELSKGTGAIRLATDSGSLAFATGPGLQGRQLTVETPDAQIAVVGTAFAVHVLEVGTCICCTDGEVSVTCPSGKAGCTIVPHDESTFFHAGQSHGTGPVMESHVAGMKKLQAYW